VTENFQTDFSLTRNLRTEKFPLNLNSRLPLLNLYCEDERGLEIPELRQFNPLNAGLNPICCLLALLGFHHFLHVSRIRVKSLNLRLLMSYIYIYVYIYMYIYIYGAPILDVSRSHTTTHHSR
jgi:hypothetical protein